MLRSPEPKMTLARSLTTKLKRGLSIRSSTVLEKPVRPTISLPLERSTDEFTADVIKAYSPQSKYTGGWVISSPPSPTSSTSYSHQSSFSSPSSRASSSSRSSYNCGDDSCFTTPLNFNKKVSFQVDTTVIPRRGSAISTASSVYAAEGELPAPPEEGGEIMKKIGVHRFEAAEYIQEIEGTPMILVDGKLYL